MLKILLNRTFGRLFAAQVIALLGTGLLTVALALLAFDLAGDRAGAVLGTALAIKMIAYVGISPIVGAFAGQFPRRSFLVAMDLVRATIAITLPFITEIWQIYLAVFLLQSASASFTPTFQATIPDVLPDEDDYTNALSLSRLAYDLESLISPIMAAALLTVIDFHFLFAGTVVGFLGSAALILSVTLPQSPAAKQAGGIYDWNSRGIRIYLATPRLRGLLALNMAAAIGGALVFVNTIVIVKSSFAFDDKAVALALACFGGGSMLAALILPRILERIPDRTIMLSAATFIALVLVGLSGVLWVKSGLSIASQPAASWMPLLIAWGLLGIGYSAVLTPSGRLLRRSAQPADGPAVFAAQFALSHACWLITYPLAGWLGTILPLPMLAGLFGIMTFVPVALASRIWAAGDPSILAHTHDNLPADHDHLVKHGQHHIHTVVIDDLHPRWPTTFTGNS